LGSGLLLLGVVTGIVLLTLQIMKIVSHGRWLQNSNSLVVPFEVNFKAPDLNQDLKGSMFLSLSRKVILVNNWATLSPCREEMPALESFYQAHRDDGFTLSIDATRSSSRCGGFCKQIQSVIPCLTWRVKSGTSF
jgi:hypothetical protein